MLRIKRVFICLSLCALSAAAFACGDAECSILRIDSFDAVFQEATSTCGPEDFPQDVDITTSASPTAATVQYHAQLIVCGGTVIVDLAQEGGTLTLTEDVVNMQGECGCFNNYLITVVIDLCAPGTYTLVINGAEHDVTI
ncbi:MAG: hypothetical protein ABIJ56_20490 [Pseudomonadota bacterium]|nr:hypothetical protein [Actinomycetota bacterium]